MLSCPRCPVVKCVRHRGDDGSGVLSSTGDMLVRGVGGVCDMCMCLARAVWVERG